MCGRCKIYILKMFLSVYFVEKLLQYLQNMFTAPERFHILKNVLLSLLSRKIQFNYIITGFGKKKIPGIGLNRLIHSVLVHSFLLIITYVPKHG